MPRRTKSILIPAAVALAAWWAFPASGIDRILFELTTRPIAESESFTSGNGTDENPFTLHSLRNSSPDLSESLPLDIVFSDESATYFETTPPSATDMAGILQSLRKLGRESVAIGMPMVWTDPSVLYLTALDRQLDSFPKVITSAPLSRRPEPSPIPSAFRRASIPLSGIKGKSQLLPIVNCVPIPDVILGSRNSLAGFTTLESEGATGLPYLLARWDDRAVLSFHLLAALDHFHIEPSEISVHLGKWISLGTDGPFIAIDEFGRLRVTPPELSPRKNPSIPAENLLLPPEDLFAGRPSGTTLIRSAISTTDPTAAEYSESLVASVAILSDREGTTLSRIFTRPPRHAELLLIASVLSLIYGLGNYPFLSGKRPLIVLSCILFILHFVVMHATSTWPPTFPLIACTLPAIPFAAAIVTPKPETAPAVESIPEKTEAATEPEPTPQKTEIAPATEPILSEEAPAPRPAEEVENKPAETTEAGSGDPDPTQATNEEKMAATKVEEQAPSKKAPRKRKQS